jgi:nucleoside-diphosphate-sugar epimerase
MRCLVTGVAGFVGSHLAERLLADGHEVYGIDAFVDYYARPIKEKNLDGPRSWNRFTFIEGNLLDIDLLPLLDGTNWVFHQAAQAGVRSSWGKEFSRYMEYNVLVTQRLLEIARMVEGIQRFIYASSSSVYGSTRILPVSETVTPLPVSPYGITKLAAEHLCRLYYHCFAFPTVSLRYFTVYGPRQRPDMAFYRFSRAILNREPIHVYGNGYQTRDFTYVSDVVEANIRAATSESAPGKIINISGGSRTTIRQTLQLLQEISGRAINVIYTKKQHGDVPDTFADTRVAEQILGYRPCVSLKDGLANEFEYISALYDQIGADVA